MGFSKESTFNVLCGSKEADENDPHSCKKPSYWKINDSVRQDLENEQQNTSHRHGHGEL